MSYCVIENVWNDLGTMYEVMERLTNEEDSISEYEQRALPNVIRQMKSIIEMYENAVEDGIIDEKGRLLTNNDDDNDSDDVVDMVSRVMNSDGDE